MRAAATRLAGIWAAVLTPLDARLQPDAEVATAYYRDLLAAGCDGVNVLGTTGEAMSFGFEQRATFMHRCALLGLPLERAMVGTGTASLDDAVRLTKLAFELGFAAALIMPPFFYRDVSDDGVLRYFDALLSRAHSTGKRIVLYNFPRMSGVTFHAQLVDRLVEAFGDAVAAIKDSSNDRELQREIAGRQPGISVFSASEENLEEVRSRGAAGCISGSVALRPRYAADAFHRGDSAAGERASALRTALSASPLIAAMRYLTARERNDEAWERSVPPLEPLSPGEGEALETRVQAALL